MIKQHFHISIDAPREKVWDVLFGVETYPQWTSAFHEGSRVETDWKKGSKALFLDDKNSGMVARIKESDEPSFLSIEHLGMYENGVEDLDSPAVKAWAGALENYTLKTVDGKTELHIDMDIAPNYAEMFGEMWPRALAKVKSIAEQN
ncbi:SRPBCC domain-containing protein [Chitinophaga lutea]